MTDQIINLLDPGWYNKISDTYESIGDYLEKMQTAHNEMYIYPDKDGSRSSEFRNRAVTNNSFNEKAIHDTLMEIYSNQSHKLMASNHDTTRFYSWIGTMKDMELIPNTDRCEFTIPIENIISPDKRDKYKLSQFYKKWITIKDILNHPDIFGFDIKLFINRRVHSEYTFRFDDQVSVIRFTYSPYWIHNNYPVYIYKYPTEFSERILVSKELCEKQWKWKIPLSYFKDQRVRNVSNVMVSFNLIADESLRNDNIKRKYDLGDNLEFFPIKDGYIDMSSISNFNKNMILSETKEYLWASVTSPKYFHEYPIILPVDQVYRPYRPRLNSVMTKEYSNVKRVKTELKDHSEIRQVYYDDKNKLINDYDDWKEMIRPIVLSDAFLEKPIKPDKNILALIRTLRDQCTHVADIIEEFRFYIKNTIDAKTYDSMLDSIDQSYHEIFETYKQFMDKISITQIDEYKTLYFRDFKEVLEDVRKYKTASKWFHPKRDYDDTFWKLTSKLIVIPRSLVDKYANLDIIDHMDREFLWEDFESFKNKIRFQRPIDVRDFWIFSYDTKEGAWRPSPLEVEHHFPDVYFLKDSEKNKDKIFKTFLFYSDTINVTQPSREIQESSPDYIQDSFHYTYNPRGNFQEIFMEKFYWNGIRSIYKDLLVTRFRWEIIEYIIDNESYERFNQLFIHTLDPYFKLGMATYMKSPDLGFPFDDAIHKLQESFQLNYLKEMKISNYERYLDKSWIPAYFDSILQILDDFDTSKYVLKRPPITFDMRRIIPKLKFISTELKDDTKTVFDQIQDILQYLYEESFHLKVSNIEYERDTLQMLLDNFTILFQMIHDLDLNIVSISQLNEIRLQLTKYNDYVSSIEDSIQKIKDDIEENNIHGKKRFLIENIKKVFTSLPFFIERTLKVITAFKIDEFMDAANNLSTYLFHDKVNPDDRSLIYQINQFSDPWTNKVKDARNKLYQSTTYLYGTYNPKKSYSDQEIDTFVEAAKVIEKDIKILRFESNQFWNIKKLNKDQIMLDRMDHIEKLIKNFNVVLVEYYNCRKELQLNIVKLISFITELEKSYLAKEEKRFIKYIKENFDHVIHNISYIAGKNKKELIDKAMGINASILEKWTAFNDKEASIFQLLFALIKTPSKFLDTIYRNRKIIHHLIYYLNTFNEEFVPSKETATYSSIYTVTKAHIHDAGFGYDKEELIFSENLAAFRSKELNEDNGIVSVEDMDYYKFQFNNPLWITRPYDTISEKEGIGARMRPDEVDEIKIIDDSILFKFFNRVTNVIVNLKAFVTNPNSYTNGSFKLIVGRLEKIDSDYKALLSRFKDHLSEVSREKLEKLIEKIYKLKEKSENFLQIRENMNPLHLYKEIQTVMEKIEEPSSQFFVKETLHKLDDYVENSSMWDDKAALQKSIYQIRSEMEMHASLTDPSLKEDFQKILNIIDKIDHSIKEFDEVCAEVSIVLDALERDSKDITLYKDTWYRIKSTTSAIPGEKYVRGDIVELNQTKINPYPYDTANKFNQDHFKRTSYGLALNVKFITATIQQILNIFKDMNTYSYDYHNELGSFMFHLDENTLLNGDHFIVTEDGISLNIENIFATDNEVDSIFRKKLRNEILYAVKPKSVIKAKENNPNFKFNKNHFIEDENGISLNISYLTAEILSDYKYNPGIKQIGGFIPKDYSIIETIEEKLLFVVDAIIDGKVKKVRPFMNYALRTDVTGVYHTIAKVGEGKGLIIKLESDELTDDDYTLLYEKEVRVNKYNDNDLFKMRFENIDQIDVKYEVFVSGIQTTNFYQTTERMKELNNNLIDTIYVNANSVNNLKNSNIFIPRENYFLYRINKILIKDSGTGYALGQTIYANTKNLPLRLTVAELKDPVFKGISKVRLKDNALIKGNENPSQTDVIITEDILNNIDDEYHISLYEDRYDQNRNNDFMYPHVDMIDCVPSVENGDPNLHFYLGSEIGKGSKKIPMGNQSSKKVEISVTETEISHNGGIVNVEISLPDDHSFYPEKADRWERIKNVIPPTDSFIKDIERMPYNQPAKSDFQLIKRLNIFRLNADVSIHVSSETLPHTGGMVHVLGEICLNSLLKDLYGTKEVETLDNLPMNSAIADVSVGDEYIVKKDRKHEYRRMRYIVRSFLPNGDIMYDEPTYADKEWNTFDIHWADVDSYPGIPDIRQMYPSANWREEGIYHNTIENDISSGKYEQMHKPRRINHSSYIHEITIDDLAVFNWTKHQWEDLTDKTKWKLDVSATLDGKDNFQLHYLEKGQYSYDMALYLVKKAKNQNRLPDLLDNAMIDVSAVVAAEIDTPSIRYSVDTGRNIIVRKLHGYKQDETFTLSDPNYTMDIRLKDSKYFRNQVLLQDVSLYNMTANRYEDIFDPMNFEIRFKDDKMNNVGKEINTYIKSSVISESGKGYIDGYIYGYNEHLHIFAYGDIVTSEGKVEKFIPRHFSMYPTEENISLEFVLYQGDYIRDKASAVVEFETKNEEIHQDGYIHRVTNPFAPLPKEFQIIPKYNLSNDCKYRVTIDNRPKEFTYTNPKSVYLPSILINERIPHNRVYILTENGRLPLVNPANNKPSFMVIDRNNGSKITILNVYKRYGVIDIRITPYPMRSVYTQRLIDKSGYIDVKGKLNKPLNRKYYEFWVNGKLITDELTIISPTKLFLHGLTSLKNFEIIEVGRDPNEYFADTFTKLEDDKLIYDFNTYLDSALEGKLEDNYTLDEQEALLTPVWKQVEKSHPSFRKYPPNTDIDPDILSSISGKNIDEFSGRGSYQYLISDLPTLEGRLISQDDMDFDYFGLSPITNNEIIRMMDEEWEEEIKNNPYFQQHKVLSDEDWYGFVTRLFNENGNIVDTIKDKKYLIKDDSIIHINRKRKSSKIIPIQKEYDLT